MFNFCIKVPYLTEGYINQEDGENFEEIKLLLKTVFLSFETDNFVFEFGDHTLVYFFLNRKYYINYWHIRSKEPL